LLDKTNKTKDFHLISPQEKYKIDFFRNNLIFKKTSLINNNSRNKFFNKLVNNSSINTINNNVFCDFNKNKITEGRFEKTSNLIFFKKSNVLVQTLGSDDGFKNIFNFFKKIVLNGGNNNFKVINHSDFGDETRILKKSIGKSLPIRFIKYPLRDNELSIEFFRFRFNDCDSTIKHKPINNSTFLTIKQKRYNIRNKINTLKFNSTVDDKKYQYSGNPFLKDISILEDNFSSPTKQYRMLKKAKTRIDNNSINT